MPWHVFLIEVDALSSPYLFRKPASRGRVATWQRTLVTHRGGEGQGGTAQGWLVQLGFPYSRSAEWYSHGLPVLSFTVVG
jgi:hypothetical protein